MSSGETSEAVRRLALAVVAQLDDLPDLMAADLALDSARRYLWIARYSGQPLDALLAVENPEIGEASRAIARLLEGRGASLEEAEAVLTQARMLAWAAFYAAVPSSPLAATLQAATAGRKPSTTLQ